MGVLQNQRWELFAQKIAAGETTVRAYELAGFKRSRSNAARLRADERISARVLEIQQAAANRAEISLEGVLRELDEAIALAKQRGQPNALINAAQLRAKLGGLLVERQQVEVV